MPETNPKPYWITRHYVHPEATRTVEETDEQGNVVKEYDETYTPITSKLPGEDVLGRRFLYFLDKDSYDAGDDPVEVFDAMIDDLPQEVQRQLLALGINARLNPLATEPEGEDDRGNKIWTLDHNLEALQDAWALWKSGSIREAGKTGAYVPMFIRDLSRGLSISYGRDFSISQTQQLISRLEETTADEEQFKKAVAALRQEWWYKQAVSERIAADAAKKQKKGSTADALLGALMAEPASEDTEVETETEPEVELD